MYEQIKFDNNGLVAVIAQSFEDNRVLMMAYANKEAIEQTIATGYMHYYSRSRQKLWKKGETSGQVQKVYNLILDCDGDAIIAKVEQTGVACHTGRKSCFFKELKDGQWEIFENPEISPKELYKKD